MAARQIYNPEGFKNFEKDGKTAGFQFQYKAQYYRGITLSIVHDIKVNVDGVDYKREDISMTVNGETFTLDQMLTVVDSDYRWEFGEFATVNVNKEGGLAKGAHHMTTVTTIVPSYMPFPNVSTAEIDFEIA